jgi:EAL domain-containing protein (putative c-di-GMP-specific phosphodiesterase class I)
VLHYQPIVSLRDGTVSHYEALVRLADDPGGQLVAPGRFLPAAERYGLIREIDRMVLAQTVALLAGEHGEHGVRVAINCSSLSITDGGMLAEIERQLASGRVDPAQLVIEVTETAAISDMARARAFCAGVQELGCAVALDDFGAGFGSFQYLKHLPFQYLKIDGDFIRELPASPQDQLVVRALVELARGMGKQTIAEYVGCAATVALLREIGVDYAQGFEVGRPHPAIPLAAYSPYLGCGNWARIATSQTRSGVSLRCRIESRAEAVTGTRDGARRREIAFSIAFATTSGPPPRWRIGPS